jgi:hypothetical protein
MIGRLPLAAVDSRYTNPFSYSYDTLARLWAKVVPNDPVNINCSVPTLRLRIGQNNLLSLALYLSEHTINLIHTDKDANIQTRLRKSYGLSLSL